MESVKKFIVLGDCFTDRWWIARKRGPSAEQDGVDIHDVDLVISRPGGAGNVAANINAMGGRVVRVLSGGLPVKNRLLVGDKQIARWDEDDFCEPITQGRLLDSFDLLDHCDGVVISDYGKGAIGPGVIEDLHEVPIHIPIFIDTKRDPAVYEVNKDVYYFPNQKEYDLYEASYRKLDNVIVTLGAEGCTALGSGRWHMAIPQRYLKHPVRSVCGAGDVVVAAFAVSENLEYAMAAAACAVEKSYTPVVTNQEVEARLSQCQNQL